MLHTRIRVAEAIVTDLKVKLANSTEAELKSLQSSLQNTKDETNADLQRNVFKK